ncbi:xanthine phosphoribosyltransferase 1 [Moelleriella libera RCEF 2490]|uniref:Xanthine phosphoribosyltransferase 1 n=1 Tax=Moelleriella libera RCEF 2490 TaxID=1081109 RepID=A0A168F2T7_9HYPO|nr:xanthine phosphoribosyltransferase 1 [Moelleriella libera RCEF 2490]
MGEKIHVTYNDVHKLCQKSADRILADFQPQLMIAIGGGGFIPARILRSFLKERRPGAPNIPIQAIGLSLYESIGEEDSEVEKIGTEVKRTQWLDLTALGQMKNLIGKRILIVDEVDDSRTTLAYAVSELEKDIDKARRELGGDQPETEFSIFVLHVLGYWGVLQNKDRPKKGILPPDMLANRYEAAVTTDDVWINYPWEALDIDEQDRLAAAQQSTS